jgi:glycosidase
VRGANVVEALPEGVIDGINYIDEQTITLVLHAPYKNSVYAIGDFNNWQVDPEYRMKSTLSDVNDLDTRYWVTLQNLVPGQEYIFQYLVDEQIRIGDPYAEKVSDPWNDEYISEATYPGMLAYPEGKTQGIATVLQTQQEEYQWEIENFTPPAIENMVVYELLIRDFTDQHTFTSLIDTMNYFKRLGVNVIELMPVNEFEGNISWGYNPNYYFAVDKYYGPKNTLKAFIDECHANDIAVVVDMVLNHSFGTSPMVMLYWDANNNQPAANNLWFNQVAKHDFNVGMDFNHESPYTRAFTKRVNDFWLTEYKVDGFRFDLSKGFTQNNTLNNTNLWGQYDQSRIDIWDDYSSAIWETKANAYVILEHFANNDEETVLANDGMLLWGNSNHNYAEATMGYTDNGGSDIAWMSYQQRNWNDPHVVGYMESHDEERVQYKNIAYGNSVSGYNIKDSAVGLQRDALAASFFFTIPGPKMIWQFGELGYDYTIDYNGRTGPKPIRWDYLDDWRREYLFHVYSALIGLKTEYEVFNTTDFTLDVYNAQKSIILRSSEMNVVVLGNFGMEQAEVNLIWPGVGTWYEFFTQSELEVSATDQSVELDRGEYRIYSSQQIPKPIWLNTAIGEANNLQKQRSVSIYPNPVSDVLNFNIKTKSPESANISIYTVMGEKVCTLDNTVLQAGENKISWPIQQKLNSGVYFATITSGQIQESVFFVVD